MLAGFVLDAMHVKDLYRIPLTENYRDLRLQYDHLQRAWKADRQQVVFLDESHFNLWSHVGRIPVRRYASQRCHSEFGIKQHSGRTPRVFFWGAIS